MEKNKQPGMSKHAVIIIVLLTAVLIMVVLLLAFPYLAGRKNFTSKEHGYTLVMDTGKTEYKRILLDSETKVTMDRFSIKKDSSCYLSVTEISEETDLDEALEAFESDESYEFTREEGITYGDGNYTARRISYTDRNGTNPLEVYYYYDKEHGIIISLCTDEKNRKELERMLGSIKIIPRE